MVMTKADFLDLMESRISASFPSLRKVHGLRGSTRRVLGRQIENGPFIWLDVSVRPDNLRVHHGVGWSPSELQFIEHVNERRTKVYPREGTLARIVRLDRPRDFEAEHMSVSVGLLLRPTDGFDLGCESAEIIAESMMDQFRRLALPYLALMLKARYGLESCDDVFAYSP